MSATQGLGPDYLGGSAVSADWRSLANNPALTGRVYNATMRPKFYQRTLLSDIANTQTKLNLTQAYCGQRIEFVEPFDIEVKKRQKNAAPKLQSLDLRSNHCYLPSEPWEYALKFSEEERALIDTRQGIFKGGMSEVIKMVQDAAVKKIEHIAVKAYLRAALKAASCDNQGTNAGAKHGNIKAGSAATPVQLNAGNAHELYGAARDLMNQQGVVADQVQSVLGDSGFVLIGDSRFEAILANSELGKEWAMSCCKDGGMEEYLTKGFRPRTLNGFSTVITDCLPCVTGNVGTNKGVVIAMARGAGSFFGVNSTFKMYGDDIFHGPGDEYAYGTFLFGQAFQWPEAIAVFQVEYQNTGSFYN